MNREQETRTPMQLWWHGVRHIYLPSAAAGAAAMVALNFFLEPRGGVRDLGGPLACSFESLLAAIVISGAGVWLGRKWLSATSSHRLLTHAERTWVRLGALAIVVLALLQFVYALRLH